MSMEPGLTPDMTNPATPARPFGFNDQLRKSKGIPIETIWSIIRSRIGGATCVYPASNYNDRQGADYWIDRKNGASLALDVKVRARDDLASRGVDDLALEVWSNVEREIVGWTRDASKVTDHVLWVWPSTGRFQLMPFAPLCAVFARRHPDWAKQYGVYRQKTDDLYHSECIFVPTAAVWTAIQTAYAGRYPLPPRGGGQ